MSNSSLIICLEYGAASVDIVVYVFSWFESQSVLCFLSLMMIADCHGFLPVPEHAHEDKMIPTLKVAVLE